MQSLCVLCIITMVHVLSAQNLRSAIGIQQPLRDTPMIDIRVIGGQLAQKGEFPSIVGLEMSIRKGKHFCTGSILNEYYVLTAGHCLVGSYSILILIDCLDMSKCKKTRSGRSILHPKFKMGGNYALNDIALVRSHRRMRAPGYSTVSVPSDLYSRCTVVGFGHTSRGDHTAKKVLYKLEVEQVLSCSSLFPIDSSAQSMLCYEGHPKKQFYLGDSGGPLFCGKHQAGITSQYIDFLNSSTGEIIVIMAWVNVSHYRDWLTTFSGSSQLNVVCLSIFVCSVINCI